MVLPSHREHAVNMERGNLESRISERGTPSLSPVLLSCINAAPPPLFLLQPGLTLAMEAVKRRHPDMFERLSSLDDPTYMIDPVDLPFAFKLSLDPDRPKLQAFRNVRGADAAATIRGSLAALIDLLQGRVDGDALFFSRALVIEGDTGAVVALRNAIESIEVDLLDDLLSLLGPLAPPARSAIDFGNIVLARANRDLAALQSMIFAGGTHRG